MIARWLKLIASSGLALVMLTGLLTWLGHPPTRDAFAMLAASNELRVCNSNSIYSQTIQSAVDAAQPGDVIKVSGGVYIESKLISGFLYNLYISKTVYLYGGYTCDDWTTRNYTANVTTIRPSTPDIAVVAIVGQFGQSALVTPTLDGFTIVGGGGGNHGGGLRITNSDAIISHNIITGNLGYLLGGGIWVQNGAPLIDYNRIENNQVTPSSGGWGGGVELESTQATLVGNVIANNAISDSVGYGGGVAVEGGGPVTLTGNTIIGNAAATITSTIPQSDVGHGGGVYIENAPVNLAGNLIQSNAANAVSAFGFGGAYGYGGGVYIVNSPAFTLAGNTIISNTASYKYYLYPSGGGVEIEFSLGSLIDNVIAGNHANGNVLFGNGGGLAILTSTLSIQGGQILNNVTSINCEGYGGGLYAFNSSIALDGVHIEKNCAGNSPFYGLGGGLAFFNTPYTLTNAIVDKNYAYPNDTAVGGLYADANSPGRLVNNTFVNNMGQGIRIASPLTLTNNIIMSHTTGVSLTAAVPVSAAYNDFYANTTHQRGFSLDISNIVINPQLDASDHLLPSSPLIDAGARTNAPDHDIDLQPRPMAGSSGLFRFDIGADEYTGTAQIQRSLATQPADFTLIGPGNPQDNPGSTGSNDWIGFGVSDGDVNGDHRDDLIVGAPNLSGDFDGGVNDDGRVWALYNTGARRLGVVDLYTTTADLEVRSWLHQQHLGRSFAASDLDGDGQRDLIIGSIGGDNNGQPVTGTVYVFAGGAGLAGTRTLSPTMQATYRFVSSESTQSFAEANSLAAGQLNGSGADDLAVGEENATGPGNRTQAGVVRVFFGSPSLPAVWDTRVLSASLTIYGAAANQHLGRVAIADFNGDGRPDLIARSASTLYVFYGPLKAGVIDLATTPADVTIGGLSGGPLAAGDVNGDGLADVAIGSGSSVQVILGNTTGAQATLVNVTPSALRVFDWNGDGKAEIVIGESFKNRAFVILGSAALSGSADVAERANWIILGEKSTDQFGYSLASGDLDADGAPDLILGSRSHTLDNRSDPHFNDAGAVYVLYGSASPGPVSPTGVSISGPTEGAVNTAYVFTATVSPVTATQPITFSWQATGQTSAMRTSNSLSDTITFTWPQGTVGAQAITVTAMNAAGAVTATRAFSISAASPSLVPLTGLVVSGASSGLVNTDYVFTATVSPVTATLPITFTWQATGQIPLTRTSHLSSDSITFTWPLGAAGDQVITATAANVGGAATSALRVTIAAYQVYLPIVK